MDWKDKLRVQAETENAFWISPLLLVTLITSKNFICIPLAGITEAGV